MWITLSICRSNIDWYEDQLYGLHVYPGSRMRDSVLSDFDELRLNCPLVDDVTGEVRHSTTTPSCTRVRPMLTSESPLVLYNSMYRAPDSDLKIEGLNLMMA